jgi:hypothetical protein
MMAMRGSKARTDPLKKRIESRKQEIQRRLQDPSAAKPPLHFHRIQRDPSIVPRDVPMQQAVEGEQAVLDIVRRIRGCGDDPRAEMAWWDKLEEALQTLATGFRFLGDKFRLSSFNILWGGQYMLWTKAVTPFKDTDTMKRHLMVRAFSRDEYEAGMSFNKALDLARKRKP